VTSQELQALQARIKFDSPSMASCMGIPYTTYKNYIYEYMNKHIPAHAERAALELEQIQKTFDVQRDEEYCRFLDAKYPQGFGEPVKLQPEPLNLS
jgi:hypothetical protein